MNEFCHCGCKNYHNDKIENKKPVRKMHHIQTMLTVIYIVVITKF